MWGSSVKLPHNLCVHAETTSHWTAHAPCGAGTRACRVPTHRDACRVRSKARPEESGRRRLRVCATSVAEKLFLRRSPSYVTAAHFTIFLPKLKAGPQEKRTVNRASFNRSLNR